MIDNENFYDENYYKSYKSKSGQEYARGKGWEEVFGNFADRIVKEIQPQKTLDVGCAVGFFVEALRDRGVEAYGIDVSEYAIASVREDIKPYCQVKSALLPIEEKYDLITCIEVLEHINSLDVPMAIQRMCAATDDIIFSSSPFDYAEESHISVHPVEYWVEQFAYNGFYHDIQYDCSYLSIQAMRFRRMEKNKIELMRDYERKIFSTHQEIVAVRNQLKTSMENVEIYREAYQKHVDMINEELNPKINELNGKLSTIESDYEEKIQNVLTEKNDEIERLKNQNYSEIEGLKNSYNEEFESLKNSHKDELESLKKSHREEFESLEKSHREELENMKYSHSSTEAESKKALEALYINKLDEEIKKRKAQRKIFVSFQVILKGKISSSNK